MQNDVKRLTVRHNFQLMPSQVSNFERVLREELKCEKRFSKPHLVAKICQSEYHEISKKLIVTKWQKIEISQLKNFSTN